jgi:hypothetical protein
MRNPGKLGKQSSAWNSAASRLGPAAVDSAKTSCPRIEPALSSWIEFFRRRVQNQGDHETPRPRAGGRTGAAEFSVARRYRESGGQHGEQRSTVNGMVKWNAAAGAELATPFGGPLERKELSGAACRRSPVGLSRTLEAMPAALAGGAVARAKILILNP